MQSMYKFMELKSSDYGIRTSLDSFSSYEKVKVVPLPADALSICPEKYVLSK